MADGTQGVAGTAAAGVGAGAKFGPYGALIGGVAGAAWGLYGSLRGNKARFEAEREQIRRQQAETAQVLGQGEAAAGASGLEVTAGSSMATHLATMAEQFRKNHDWAAKQAAIGKGLQDQAASVNFLSTIGGSLFNFAQAKNWWQDAPKDPTTGLGG